MGVLLLVRHGQASLGAPDYDQLSEIGRRQARVTGTRLAGADLAVDRVVSGAMTRQRDTAQAILAALGRPGSQLQTDERLDEYDHVGVMARHSGEISFRTAAAGGESGRALQSALEEAIGRWISGGPGYQETHDAFTGRVLDAVRDLIAAPGGTVAVTSGGAGEPAVKLGLDERDHVHAVDEQEAPAVTEKRIIDVHAPALTPRITTPDRSASANRAPRRSAPMNSAPRRSLDRAKAAMASPPPAASARLSAHAAVANSG